MKVSELIVILHDHLIKNDDPEIDFYFIEPTPLDSCSGKNIRILNDPRIKMKLGEIKFFQCKNTRGIEYKMLCIELKKDC